MPTVPVTVAPARSSSVAASSTMSLSAPGSVKITTLRSVSWLAVSGSVELLGELLAHRDLVLEVASTWLRSVLLLAAQVVGLGLQRALDLLVERAGAEHDADGRARGRPRRCETRW